MAHPMTTLNAELRKGGMLRCSTCKEVKPLTEFYRSAVRPSGYRQYCKACNTAYDLSPASIARSRARLLQRYGITVAEYDALMVRQGGVCAICGAPPSTTFKHRIGELAVDHDHATGKVRGLLCSICNQGIGMFRDDPTLMEKAATYARTTR